ncbi:MAG: hypothetical protein LBG59_00755 [Candidatus Peribacteria bacterium]|nr:hypothetical protein [Candidatus Peribacteria bacterium]
MPLAGEIEDSNGIFKSSTSDRIGAYRSSTRQTNDEAYELYFSASTVAT